MKRAALVLLVALLGIAPREAEASRRCRETSSSPLLGESRCTHFGQWTFGAPPPLTFQLELDAGVHRLSLRDRALGVAFDDAYGSHAFAVPPVASLPDATAAYAAGASLELLALGPFRLGVHGAYGVAPMTSRPFTALGRSLAVTSITYDAYGLLPGIAFGVGPIGVRAQALVGVEDVDFKIATRGATILSNPTAQTAGAVAFAPRASIEAFLSPWVSVAAYGECEVIARRDLAFGVALRLYGRPFDGLRGG